MRYLLVVGAVATLLATIAPPAHAQGACRDVWLNGRRITVCDNAVSLIDQFRRGYEMTRPPAEPTFCPPPHYLDGDVCRR